MWRAARQQHAAFCVEDSADHTQTHVRHSLRIVAVPVHGSQALCGALDRQRVRTLHSAAEWQAHARNAASIRPNHGDCVSPTPLLFHLVQDEPVELVSNGSETSGTFKLGHVVATRIDRAVRRSWHGHGQSSPRPVASMRTASHPARRIETRRRSLGCHRQSRAPRCGRPD